MQPKKSSVLDKITMIVLGGSFIGAIFVGVMIFILLGGQPDAFMKTIVSTIIIQVAFLIPVFMIRSLVDKLIVSKLKEVSNAMNEVSMGNLDHEIKIEKSGDELEDLADSFERMRISMKTIMEKLEKGEL